MADGAAIGFHNAFKDSAVIFPFIEAVSSSAADTTGSFLGNATEGTDDLLLVTQILRWMNLKTSVKRCSSLKPEQALTWSHKQISDIMHYGPINFF